MDEDLRRRRIMVGVHGSAASVAALRWAAREAGLLGMQLHVVRAWEPEAAWVAPYAPHASLAGQDEARTVACAWLEQSVQAVVGAPPGIGAAVEIADGLAARVLLERAVGAELLVLGGAVRTAPEGIGPTARACLRHVSCPVVIVSVETARSLEPA